MKRVLAYLSRSENWLALLAGMLYGIVAQLTARLPPLRTSFVVMSVGYVFVLPLLIGVVTSLARPREAGFWGALGWPLLSCALCLLAAGAVGWEGSICLIMAAPVYLTLAVLGGTIGYLIRRYARPRPGVQRMVLGPVLLLPLVAALAEQHLPDPREQRVVRTHIDISAPADVVWRHIARVERIVEPQESFFFAMGFPRPVEALLDRDGVGSVRQARFERGLTFVETVTEWQPSKALRFRIAVDPKATPLTTLDAHVTVGGAFFDVLEGGYRIEPLGPGRVRLHLDSRHRLSTHYNFYASLWSDYLMAEIQDNILRVLRSRCERAAFATALNGGPATR
jgi:hypothetical protein